MSKHRDTNQRRSETQTHVNEHLMRETATTAWQRWKRLQPPPPQTTAQAHAHNRSKCCLRKKETKACGYLRFHRPVHGGRLRRRVAVGVGGLGAWRHWRLLRFGLGRLRRTLDVFPVSLVGLRQTHVSGFSGGLREAGRDGDDRSHERSRVSSPPPAEQRRVCRHRREESSSSKIIIILAPHPCEQDGRIRTEEMLMHFSQSKKTFPGRAAVQDFDPPQNVLGGLFLSLFFFRRLKHCTI